VIRTGFELEFEPISAENPAWGAAALVPWDTEIFGFRVAVYKPSIFAGADMAHFGAGFASWMKTHTISLCSCVLPAADSSWSRRLSETGFRLVDCTLQVSLEPLSAAHLPETRLLVRLATPDDHPAIEAIAKQSFTHGRYHADPLFSNELADRRYLRWVQNALSGARAEDRVFVLCGPAEVMGFYHGTVEGEVSDLRLVALAPQFRETGAGMALYTGALRELRKLGIREVISSISGANAAAINVHSRLGFHFRHPERVYHWHAKHLRVP
jgi:L-amino acid N-acyltransferase YncA